MKSSLTPAHSITGWLRRLGSSTDSFEPGPCTVRVSTPTKSPTWSATPSSPGNDGATFSPSQMKALLNTSGKDSESLLAIKAPEEKPPIAVRSGSRS
ncbi:hypothetical protein GCM10023215_59250 [Pseudonocardia yuanmonensis]|uniref:Uncharacterized protein n=1 Tax=Pseudonocardia yuanmonensis TaxID=1095914 RepID=A0ABP8XK06_9PSEU